MKIERFKDARTGRWKWKADLTCAGVRHRPVADSKDELLDEVDAIRRRARAARYGLPVERRAVALDELVAEHTRDFDLRDKNRRRARTVLLDFASRLKAKGVREVTAADLRDYARALKSEFRVGQKLRERTRRERAEAAGKRYEPRKPPDLSPHSLNKCLNFVSAMLNAAPHLFEADLGDYRPPRVPWASVPRRWRRRPVSQDEDGLLLAKLREPRAEGERERGWRSRLEVADLFEVALNTGMRPGECVRLTWPQVDFESGEIYLGRTKTGEDRFVPVNSRVAELLGRRRAEATSKFVFPNPEGTAPRSSYYRAITGAARALGLPYGQRVENGFTLYSTRHTAATRMLRAGADISSVQEILGHSNATMSLHYSHATRATTRRAAESLVRGAADKNSTGEEGTSPEVLSTEHVGEG
ncbi:MAG TPA: site-specific integrase [Pyrinomonadaceae bacterium]|jgi:integrase|nr:site-specific integrase [Pyrinomonadaceae bacterium]